MGYELFGSACQAPAPAKWLVVVVLPVVYLALMYLTFASER